MKWRTSAGRALFLLLAGLSAVLLPDLRRLGAEPKLLPEPAFVAPPPMPVEEAPLPQAAGDCPADPPTPAVAIRVRVPAFAAPGQEVTYRICVENCSPAAAHHVVVRNPLPANARFVKADPEPDAREPELLWRFGTLGPCACKEITLVLAPTGEGDLTNCARVQFEHGQCVRTRMGRGQLELRKTGPARAVLYDSLTFQLVVANPGATEATNVVLTDTLPEGLEHAGGKNVLSWDLDTLAPGQSRRAEYQAIAKKADRLCNKAVVTAAGGLREEASHCVVVTEPKLQLIMTGPLQRYLNRPATYQITVTNPGSAVATNVVISNVLPPGTTLVSASPGARTVGNQVQWPIGPLPPGARRTVQLSLRAQAEGEVRNRASATAARGLSAQAEAVTKFEGAVGITVDIDDRDDPVEVGRDTSYLITVTNQGNVPATKVQVTALVPEQMAVTDVKGPAKDARDGGKIAFEPITVAPGATASFEVFVKPLKPGDVRFRVEVGAEQLPAGPVRREESTTIYTDLPAPQTAPPPVAPP
jgi:uncharacterized repeat protein (TIGR01451 family)